MHRIGPFLFASIMALGCGGGSSAPQPPVVYSLTLNSGPNGTITADPAGPTYAPGTLVTLTATPNAPWTIQGWTGTDNDASTQPVNHVTMSRNRTVSVQFVAQANCPADPVTGNVVARMISPANGSTLPAGAVTFTWCNASADYFLTIESIPGAHDIFFAFAGGAGGGAGVNTLTLGPACAPAPPTGCIPAKGETIHVTLYTLKQGNILAPSPFQYTYTAAAGG
jgi:List-Bact-rpt repeat protein